MIEKLKNINFIMCIFVFIGLRLTFFSASIGDAIVGTALCSYFAFLKWNETYLLTKKQLDVSEAMQKELNDVKASMSGLMIKSSMRPTVNTSNEPVAPMKFF